MRRPRKRNVPTPPLPAAPAVSRRLRAELAALLLTAPLIAGGLLLVVENMSLPVEPRLVIYVLLLIGLTVSTALTFRIAQSGRYDVILLDQGYQLLRHRLARMPEWDAAEPVLAFTRVLRGGIPFFLILTPGRLMLVRVLGFIGARVDVSLPLASLHRVEYRPLRGWRKLLSGGTGSEIVIHTVGSGRKPWSLSALCPPEVELFRPVLEECLRNRGHARRDR